MRALSSSTRVIQSAAALRSWPKWRCALAHQALADVGTGAHVHAQAVGGVLLHEAPLGALELAALALAQAVHVEHAAVGGEVADTAFGGRDAPGNAIEQRALARARFADDGNHLARVEREACVAHGEGLALGEAVVELGHREQGRCHPGFLMVALSSRRTPGSTRADCCEPAPR